MLPGVKLGGAHFGRLILVEYVFAEGLAGYVHAGIEREAGVFPRGCSAAEALHVGVAELFQAGARALSEAFAGIAHDDAYGFARQESRHAYLEVGERHVGSEQQVPVAREDAFLADVEERDLAPVVEHAAQRGSRYVSHHCALIPALRARSATRVISASTNLSNSRGAIGDASTPSVA